LIHSKLFKENLKKWLFMYVAIMGLLTSVITYSKYISNFQGSGDAVRSAKFNVKINSLNSECPQDADKIVCSLEAKRPTQIIDFTVQVDATELEVSAEVLTRLNLLNSSYEIIGLVQDDGTTLYDSENNTINSKVQKTSNGSLIVTDNFNVGSNKIITYKVRAVYINNSTDQYTYGEITEVPVLQVGYTATQIN
ncbi:MAG: hypothetical protein K2G03_01435, partial [Bacilli bacterium]|nr:hypothetical protein [Bacilli bacterium]